MRIPESSENNKSENLLNKLKCLLKRQAILGVLMGAIAILPATAHAEGAVDEREAKELVKSDNMEKYVILHKNSKFFIWYPLNKINIYPLCLRKSNGRTCAIADNSEVSPKEKLPV